MKPKEYSYNERSFNKISKNGLLENDKKLLIQKLGFNNLSHSNLIKKYNSSNNYNNINNNKKRISNLKIETKPIISTPLLINHNSKHIQHIITSTAKNSNNISIFSTNEHLHSFSEIKKSSEFLAKKINNKKNRKRNYKSCTDILKPHPDTNINIMSNSTTNKKPKKIKIRNNNKKYSNSNIINTGQNSSFKTNKINKSHFNLLAMFPKLDPIKKNNNKNNNKKIKNNASTPNLLNKVKKPIIKDKEKSHKIFKDRGFMNKNLYNYSNYNHNYKPKIMSSNNTNNNSRNKRKDKIKKILDISRKYLQMNKNTNVNKKENKINKEHKELNDKNTKKKQYISIIPQTKTKKKDKSRESRNNNINITGSKNSEDTKKESRLDLHNLINDKILNNLKNKNNIYDIISINMKKHLSDIEHINNLKTNEKLNEQKTINIEDEDDENYNLINLNSQIELNNKILLSNVINNITHNINNNINNNVIFKNKAKSNKNIINYTCINEKANLIKSLTDEENNKHSKKSSIKTNKNLNNKYYNLMNLNLNLINKDDQEFHSSQDKNNDQTQTTVDRNNIISKYIKQPIYNISPRFFSPENHSMTKYSLKIKSFKFINDIEQINKNIPVINIKKLLALKDKPIFKILSFSYDNYDSIIESNNLLKNKFNNSLINIFTHVIDDFQNKYQNFLKVLNYSFKPKKFNSNKKQQNTFNLIIKSKIITTETKKSYEIGCNYISYGKKYDNIWKFDVHDKKDIKLWLCTELNIVNKIKNNFTYTSQVSSFSYLDEIILEFNIFSKGNNIDPYSIEWTEPIISDTNIDIYENRKFHSSIPYDELRACEVETQILFWKNKIIDDRGIVEDFKKIFEKFFKIKEINYDISKFYFFKFKMIANKVGVLKQNRYLSFDINIIEYESNIQNEIQCIYLLNSNSYNKSIDIRINTLLTFYIIDMKR